MWDPAEAADVARGKDADASAVGALCVLVCCSRRLRLLVGAAVDAPQVSTHMSTLRAELARDDRPPAAAAAADGA